MRWNMSGLGQAYLIVISLMWTALRLKAQTIGRANEAENP